MGLEKVIDEILSDAERAARDTISGAKGEAAGIAKKAREDAARMEQAALSATAQKIAQMEESEIGAQELENKKRMLNARKSVLDGAYLKAEEKIRAMPKKEKEKIYSRCIEAAKKRLKAKYVHCTPADKAIVEKLAKGMKVIPDISGIGGIIIEDASHERMENYTFEAAMERLKGSALSEVYGMLFGGGE